MLMAKPQQVSPLSSAPEADNLTTVPFRGSALARCVEMLCSFTLLCGLQARLAACLCLAIECLRHRRRPAHLAEQQDFHLKIAAVVCYLQHVANPHFAGSLGGLPVRLNPAE